MTSLQEDDDALVLAFANAAAASGWTARTLARFCELRGIAEGEMRRRWPSGVRSLARQLNARADARMLARFERAGPTPLSSVLLSRFEDNAIFKAAVGRLALSDFFHPLDTLRRTVVTAEAMWLCQNAPFSASRLERRVRTAALVLAYSTCVLIWLGGASADGRILPRAVRCAARAVGGR